MKRRKGENRITDEKMSSSSTLGGGMHLCGLILLLHLCFSEEFNDRILCPELSDSQKMMLHEELRKIYETYCLDESIDKIRFDPFIVEEIRNSTPQPLSPPFPRALASKEAVSFLTSQSRRGRTHRW